MKSGAEIGSDMASRAKGDGESKRAVEMSVLEIVQKQSKQRRPC